MRSAALTDTLLLGALTGMRSMAGPAALALRRGGFAARLASVFAAGEMAADKTPYVGDRTDALPLGGRALMGAAVGGYIAHEDGGSVLMGAAVGAVAAVAMAHIAYELRKRFPGSTAVGGFIEDAIVVATGAMHTRARLAR